MDEDGDRMKVISEETPTEENQGEMVQVQYSSKSSKGHTANGGEVSSSKVHTSNKEKLMAKLPNLKVSISSKRDKHVSDNADAVITPDGKFKSDKNPLGEKSKVDKKKSGKMNVALAPSHAANIPSSPSPTSLSSGINLSKTQNGEGFSFSPKNIESLEQVRSFSNLLFHNIKYSFFIRSKNLYK